jgi:hypothetical protein
VAPSGRWVAALDAAGAARLWRADAPPRRLHLRSLAAAPVVAATVPSSRWAMTGHADGALYLWQLDRQPLVRAACALAGRSLTRDEWGRYLPGVPYKEICSQP